LRVMTMFFFPSPETTKFLTILSFFITSWVSLSHLFSRTCNLKNAGSFFSSCKMWGKTGSSEFSFSRSFYSLKKENDALTSWKRVFVHHRDKPLFLWSFFVPCVVSPPSIFPFFASIQAEMIPFLDFFFFLGMWPLDFAGKGDNKQQEWGKEIRMK
jgi:hypothetical protein